MLVQLTFNKMSSSNVKKYKNILYSKIVNWKEKMEVDSIARDMEGLEVKDQVNI